MKRIYNGVVFTNHALERMEQRNIKQGDAWATIHHPDNMRNAQRKQSYVFYRVWGNRKVEVVASKNEKKEWVVLSVWDKPVWGAHARSHDKMGDSILKRVLKGLLSVLKG